MMKIKVLSLDVVGDSDSGWEVNDVHSTNDIFSVDDDATDDVVFRALVLQVGFTGDHNECSIEWWGDANDQPGIIIGQMSLRANGKPLYQFRLM